MNFDATGGDSPTSRILKAGNTCSISFSIALDHRLVPVSQSICNALSTDVGTSIPNLKSFFFLLAFIVEMKWFLFFRV
jgi:hypothetical protein